MINETSNVKRKHYWLINIARSLKESHQTGQMFITAFALKGNKILAIGCNNYNIKHPEKRFGIYINISILKPNEL